MDIIHSCRICHSSRLEDVIDLGNQWLTSRFPKQGDISTPQRPITLCLCSGCSLLQLRQTTPSQEMYEHDYGYRSGISDTMRSHLRSLHEELVGKTVLREGDTVLDIGSNDSTFLKFYRKDLVRVGIDPTGRQFSAYYTDEVLLPEYFSKAVFEQRFPGKKCRIVSSIAMFYDLPDPVRFATDVCDILEEDGVWVCEQSYLLSMLDTNSIDTICHEHLEYYGLSQIKAIMDRAGLKIVDVRFNASNGGSFRVYSAKKDSNRHAECSALIQTVLAKEEQYGVHLPQTYQEFHSRCADEARRLKMLVQAINASGRRVWVYGASTKGNCTLQFAGLTKEDLPYAVERNPQKVGRMTPTGIPIISEEQMRSDAPEFLLVLPWHFRDEIIRREHGFLEKGGMLVFPFPSLEIFSTRPKMLLTGCDGHIASYFLDHYHDEYAIFGVGHTPGRSNAHGIPRFYPPDDQGVCDCLLAVKPDHVLHLAGISNSYTALEDPIGALDSTGRMLAVLCACAHRNDLSTRIVNASSSEIFKGHAEYTVRPMDNFYYHLHPYSISKIVGHSFVDFYREQHQRPYYNAILFTVESCRKDRGFLLNKLAHHSHQWPRHRAPVRIGSMESSRNILHALDAVRALHTMLQSGESNYVVCHQESHVMEDLVTRLYEKAGIMLVRRGDFYVDRTTGGTVLIIDTKNKRNEPRNDIQGDNSSLRALGWKPTVSIDGILTEISQHAASDI